MNWPFDSVPPATARKRTQQESACPECCGEGFIETIGGPGYFDEQRECWMPNCEIEPCAACRGTGLQETPEAPAHGADAADVDPSHDGSLEDAESALPF